MRKLFQSLMILLVEQSRPETSVCHRTNTTYNLDGPRDRESGMEIRESKLWNRNYGITCLEVLSYYSPAKQRSPIKRLLPRVKRASSRATTTSANHRS